MTKSSDQKPKPVFEVGHVVEHHSTSPHGHGGHLVQTGIVVAVREDDGAASVGWFTGVSGPIPPDDLQAV